MRRFLPPPWTLIFLAASTVTTASAESSAKRRSFQQWCEDQTISVEARRTVTELLLLTREKDCRKAQKSLLRFKLIRLGPANASDQWKVEVHGPQPPKQKEPNLCSSPSGCHTALFANRWRNVSDLRPLESFDWIEALDLDHNLVTDVRPIMHLKNLEFLSLENNPIRINSCPLPWIKKDRCLFTPESK
jgi:hypothetical protein